MIKQISEGENHTAVNIGDLSSLSDYEFKHPRLGTVLKSKLFLGEILKATGTELSFREVPPKTNIPFLHKHHKHEEIYIVLKGRGKYQIDDTIFDISEGSIVRVAPNGIRTLSNIGDEVMIYMVIQAHSNTITGRDVYDGYRVKGEIKI